MKIDKKFQLGVTLIELIVVISISITLLGIATIGLSGAQRTASTNSTAQTIISDIKEQQIKAMIGDTEGRSSPDFYGVHFDANQYVLFHGTVYSSSDTSNYVISLSNLKFVSPGFDVIFSKISGEIVSSVVIQLQDIPTGKLRKIHLSQYGVVTQMESL